jgi:LysR family glycine cleavage system transcriptional activator
MSPRVHILHESKGLKKRQVGGLTLVLLKYGMPLPIRDLYTFFVVARAGAMQAAARELGVTPGAISQRIRSIEKHHGKRLFVRSRDGISLTVSGKSLWKEVEGAFARIEASHRRHFCKNGQTTLRISAAPTFAHSFLVSNLASFNQVHPAIKLSIETDDRLVDLRSEPIDLAIRHGLGAYPGLRSDWLCAPELIVVGSPTLLESQPPVLDQPSPDRSVPSRHIFQV